MIALSARSGYTVYSVRGKVVSRMRRYEVGKVKDGTLRYYFVREIETLDIEPYTAKYLKHYMKSNRSPNTARRASYALCFYLEYLHEKKEKIRDPYEMSYDEQYQHFTEFLTWLKRIPYKTQDNRIPLNKTCNAYLKDVFRFYFFMEQEYPDMGYLKVLSYQQTVVANAAGVRKTLRYRSFKGYLKDEERDVRAARKNELLDVLKACTNCRDQLLILLIAELGFRLGEILGIDYTKDILYETHEVRVRFRADNENEARAKNAEERKGKLSEDTFLFLMHYISEYRELLQHQTFLFINISGDTKGKPLTPSSVYDMFERMEEKTGTHLTPHMIRRYFGNVRYEAGWSLELISYAYGHRHLETTTAYLDIIDSRLIEASNQFYEETRDIYGVDKLLMRR